MTDMMRARAGLEKLLKFARLEVEALRTDLADVARVKSSAEASLTGLDETLRREEAVMKEADDANFAAYQEGMRARRHNLQTTLLTLGEAEANANRKLEAALVEIRKFENIIEINERARKNAGACEDLPTPELRAADGVAAARAAS